MTLVPSTADLVDAELLGAPVLARELGVKVSPDWPPDDMHAVLEFFANQLRYNPNQEGWRGWYWIANDLPVPELIGNGGFKGPPDPLGQVEIGYEVLDPFRGRGYATEAVRAMVRWALDLADVDTVVAECLPDNVASQRVLSKAGFVEIGDGLEEGTRLWRWRGFGVDQ